MTDEEYARKFEEAQDTIKVMCRSDRAAMIRVINELLGHMRKQVKAKKEQWPIVACQNGKIRLYTQRECEDLLKQKQQHAAEVKQHHKEVAKCALYNRLRARATNVYTEHKKAGDSDDDICFAIAVSVYNLKPVEMTEHNRDGKRTVKLCLDGAEEDMLAFSDYMSNVWPLLEH